jgi:hypothetical protein
MVFLIFTLPRNMQEEEFFNNGLPNLCLTRKHEETIDLQPVPLLTPHVTGDVASS